MSKQKRLLLKHLKKLERYSVNTTDFYILNYTSNMSMYPIDPSGFDDNRLETCPICNAPANMECHPACPSVEESEDEMDFGVFISNALMSATEDYFEQLVKKQQETILTERTKQFKADWIEVGEFAKALFDAGLLTTAEQVVRFITHTYEYTAQYLVWLELNKPKKEDEYFNLFVSEALNRRK